MTNAWTLDRRNLGGAPAHALVMIMPSFLQLSRSKLYQTVRLQVFIPGHVSSFEPEAVLGVVSARAPCAAQALLASLRFVWRRLRSGRSSVHALVTFSPSFSKHMRTLTYLCPISFILLRFCLDCFFVFSVSCFLCTPTHTHTHTHTSTY